MAVPGRSGWRIRVKFHQLLCSVSTPYLGRTRPCKGWNGGVRDFGCLRTLSLKSPESYKDMANPEDTIESLVADMTAKSLSD
jgi:hypothetical protein